MEAVPGKDIPCILKFGKIKYQRAIFTYKDKVIIVDNDRIHYFTGTGQEGDRRQRVSQEAEDTL